MTISEIESELQRLQETDRSHIYYMTMKKQEVYSELYQKYRYFDYLLTKRRTDVMKEDLEDIFKFLEIVQANPQLLEKVDMDRLTLTLKDLCGSEEVFHDYLAGVTGWTEEETK